MTPLGLAGMLAAAVAAWVLVVRRRAGARIETAARRIRGYAVERRDRELVVYRHHQGPLGFLETPEALRAGTYLDLLHVSAERKGRPDPGSVRRAARSRE